MPNKQNTNFYVIKDQIFFLDFSKIKEAKHKNKVFFTKSNILKKELKKIFNKQEHKRSNLFENPV